MPRLKTKNLGWLDWLGAGGLAVLLLLAGFITFLAASHWFVLIARGEGLLFNLPSPFIWNGLALWVLSLGGLKWLLTVQKRKVGWAVRSGKNRDSPLQWEELIVCSLGGALLFSIGAGLLLNCYADSSPPLTHETRILEKRVYSGKNTTYGLIVADWKVPGAQIALPVRKAFYDTLQGGARIQVKTKTGTLGYEWLVEIEG